jgi:hypothetical protein
MSDQESRYTQAELSVDELAKGLANGTVSRRGALRMMGAALLGSALASIPSIAWAAKPAPCLSGNKCAKNCCPDASFVCSKGKCACPSGMTQCGDDCLDPSTFQTDPNNCGACGNPCSGGKTCQSGVCACPPRQSECENTCRDLHTDTLNCGACDFTCEAGHSCVDGLCVGPCIAGNIFCCSCSYVDPNNPNEIAMNACKSSNCTGPVSGEFNCGQFCEDNTPPGMILGGLGVGCHDQSTTPGEHVVCGPFPSTPGSICQQIPCMSPAG